MFANEKQLKEYNKKDMQKNDREQDNKKFCRNASWRESN